MIQLTDSIKSDINNAFDDRYPVIVVGVTPDSEPTVSFRGTAQAFGDDAIAFWSRKPGESKLVASLSTNPTVVLVYANVPAGRFYQFTGKAHLSEDATANATVWENSPEFERNQDPDRSGKAVIVKLTNVRGRGADGPVMMSA